MGRTIVEPKKEFSGDEDKPIRRIVKNPEIKMARKDWEQLKEIALQRLKELEVERQLNLASYWKAEGELAKLPRLDGGKKWKQKIAG